MECDEEIGLNLELLSEQERNIIVKVLERDDVLQKVKDSKVGELKVEIQNIRQKTIMHGHDDLSKMCVRCRSELGRLFNRGSLCSQCHFRVCLLCQEKLFNGSILCILCYKLRQLKWLTGEWGAGGHVPLRRWLSGTDLVKSTLSLPQTVLSSTTRTQDDSDIPDNTRLSRQLERNGSARPIVNNDDDKVHYPQDSDKKKLTELFDSFFTKNPESATREKHSRSVKYISTRVFEDSDSSSTASDAEITIAHIPSAQSFTVVLKDDNIPLAHSFPSAHSLPADSSSTPVNGEKFVDGTAGIATGEKKKVHAPKLSFSEASHSSFDASKDSSLFSAENSFIKNQSNMNNSIEDSVFKQSESKSESPQFGPSPSRAQRRLTATETIMAMKMAKQLSSTPVQSNSASASSVHDGRTESPIECTMGSLPSSHASSPVSVRNAHLSSLEFKTRQESTDSDSLLKISQDAEFCGADSLPREGPEFVVEEISKIRFQRMSRRAAQCSIPSSAHKSREHSSPEPQQYSDCDIDCAVSDAFSALDQHTHTPITGASGKLLLDHEKNIDQQVVQKDSVEEWKIIEIPVTELSEVDSSHAVLKPKSYNNLCVGQKNEMTSDPIRELFVSDKQSFSNITSSEISEMTSQDCDLSLILPVNTSSMDPHMLTFLGTDLVWDEDQQNICTKQEFENRQCMHPDSMMTDSVFAENICYEDLWPSDNDSSDGFLSNISFPKSETKISSKKLSPWHFKEDNLENDTDKFFGETDFVNKSKSTRVKGQLVPMTRISSDSSNIPSAIIEESVPIDEEFKIKQDKCSGTKVATRLHTLKRTVVDPVKEDNLFDNNTSKIPRVERIIGSEKNNYSTLETVIEDLGRHNDESKSDIFLNENRNGKRSVQSKLETNFSNDISPIAPEKTKQGNISQDKHLPNILSENSQREILTLVDGDSSDVVGTRLVPSVTVPVTHHKSRDDASVHLTRVSEDTELQPVIKVGHYKKFRDRMLKPSVGKLPASKSTESLEFVKTITAMKIDEETMEEENDNFIDEKTIHRMTEPIKNTINIESQPIKYGLTEKTVEIGVTESQVMKNVTVKLAGSGEMVSQTMKIGLTEETVEIGETMAKSPNTGTDNVMHSMKGTPYQGGREQEGHMPNSNVQVLALARQYDLQTSTEKVPVVKLSDESTSLEDSGLVSEASHDTTPEHRRTDSSNSQSSIPSLTFSVRTDHSHEDDDIDSIVASHRSLYSSLGGSHGNLLTTIADSRESIMSFYSNAGDVDYGKIPITGDILFGLDYNYRTGSLEVMINKCQNIAPVDTKHKRSDPYVKTYLLPDKTHSGKRKTKIKKHTLNPTFDEVLRYVISNSELESRTLWVSVWHSDRFGRNDFLGEVTINFDYYKFGDSTPKWYPLHERMDTQHHSVLAYKGDIILSIRYVTSDKLVHDASSSPMPSRKKAKKSKPAYSQGELQVLIKEARNLTAVRSNGYSDPFCKGFLLPETKHKSCKQKTPVMKKDCNPVWNYTLMFDDVSLEELQERCLELSIWDQDRLLGNDFLGGLRLNLGLGLSSGKHVDWMDAKGEEISVWQSMLEHPNTWIDGALILRPSMNKRHH